MSIPWNWRTASRLSVITLAILVVIVVLVYQRVSTEKANSLNNNPVTATGLQGTDLGKTPVTNFTLIDQNGKTVSLSDFKGQPVVVTFMFTQCPDQCPLEAQKLHSTLQLLGSDANHVTLLAVSTDPHNDTPQAALQFTQAHSLDKSNWHFLTGTSEKLSPVWNNFHVFAGSNGQTADHSLGIYVLDKQGNERVFQDSAFTPDQLANNLKKLLAE
ncbi:SCO family protein [Ktedonospora formicarum]|uniref:Photosynthetic protein synthase I n=1 Tax=Ktedonospora formicarum TaxID=2778364 RepID=A0A8J3HZ83_9CHLR|nr:SCO family protein [Ktedonospora formicarum]GHO43718.1 photosynthetic protein synthase I [Ktedonospora formicarum]